MKPDFKKTTILIVFLFSITIIFCNKSNDGATYFGAAKRNGQLANEGFKRCQNYMHDWLEYADPATGLLPRDLGNGLDIWDAHNSAADNYPFMVLTSSLIDSALFKGRMHDILNTETRLTSRLGSLPDTYSFSKKGFADEQPDIDRIIFGASEYIKDGLLPLTEYLGKSPWSKRMLDLVDDIWSNAPIETQYGLIPSTNVEVNGEQLQILSRIYWMTGEQKYLDWAMRLSDYYLLGDHHPTRDFELLRLRDHGCEIVAGLCELYVAVNYARPDKKQQYQKPIYLMLDRILEVGRNEDGLFYNKINPITGEIIDAGIADTYGYVYNGYYSIYAIDNIKKYRDAVLFALGNLDNYRNYNWERLGADGFADAIESALNLYNREPMPDVAKWINGEIKVMWSLQDSAYRENAQQWKDSGIIEGWYGDGNFARTTIMYCFWKSQGIAVSPWRDDVNLGAVFKNDELFISIESEQAWEGKLRFDNQRHKTILQLPIDYTRINQFHEWFTVEPQLQYEIRNLSTNSTSNHSGSEMENGIFIKLDPNERCLLKVKVL